MLSSNKKILILTGLPKAGKSVVSAELYELCRKNKFKFFMERLAPDCEGIWTAESSRNDLAKSQKELLKKKNQFFADSFVKFKINSIKSLAKTFDLLILDLGGVPSQENKMFIDTAKSTNSKIIPVLLAKKENDKNKIKEWADFLGNQFILIESNIESANYKIAGKNIAEKLFGIISKM